MKIALDIDGTLADTMAAWIRHYNERFGESISVEQAKVWSFWKELGISREEYVSIFSEAWSKWKEVSPIESNVGAKVNRLRLLGEVDIVTGRTSDTIDYVKNWLDYHKISYRKFVPVNSMREKVKLGYDVFIDDSPDVADEASKNGLPAMLFDRLWNKHVTENAFIKRVKELEDAISEIDRL